MLNVLFGFGTKCETSKQSYIYIGVNVLFKVLESVESECPKQKRITHVHRSNDAAICPVLIAT